MVWDGDINEFYPSVIPWPGRSSISVEWLQIDSEGVWKSRVEILSGAALGIYHITTSSLPHISNLRKFSFYIFLHLFIISLPSRLWIPWMWESCLSSQLPGPQILKLFLSCFLEEFSTRDCRMNYEWTSAYIHTYVHVCRRNGCIELGKVLEWK